jgi:hypothetical protein
MESLVRNGLYGYLAVLISERSSEAVENTGVWQSTGVGLMTTVSDNCWLDCFAGRARAGVGQNTPKGSGK